MSKRVLLTGGTGFVGSHVIERLLHRGHQVALLTRPTSDLRRVQRFNARLETFDRERVLCGHDLRAIGHVDAIIHLATVYGRGEPRAQELIETNIAYPARLLQLAVSAGVTLFINTDTYSTKVAGPFSHLPAYCLSKTQFAQWATLIARGTGTRIASMRLEHVYGPNDAPDKFTRWVIRACLDGREALQLTAGEQERDFIYIGDAADAYVRVVEAAPAPSSQDYEVGRGQATSVRKWVEMVHRMSGSLAELQFGALPYREGEIMSSKADTTALQRLGWRAATALEDGLHQTIEWEKSQLANAAARGEVAP